MTEVSFLLYYATFLIFVVYVSGLAGYDIIMGMPDVQTTFEAPSITNFLAPFGYFLALLTLSTEYQIIFTLILSPVIIVLVYIIIKALPFT